MQTNSNQRWRYYTCGCAYASSAREMGRPPCDLPAVHASDIEAELWRVLNATLLNGEYLAAGLQAAGAEHEQADHLRAERLATIDAEIAKYRKRLDSLTDELADVGDGEFRASIRRRAQEIEGLIGRLRKERDASAATPGVGLSDEEADAIEAFAAEAHAGMDAATPADVQQRYGRLQVRGTVRPATDGDRKAVRLGRLHSFRVDWTAAIPLLDSEDAFL